MPSLSYVFSVVGFIFAYVSIFMLYVFYFFSIWYETGNLTIPTFFSSTVQSALILWMMSEDPAQRPTAQQLIEFEMFAIPPDMYSSLHIQLQDKTKALDQKDSEVTRLRAAMAEKQRECDEMRLKIKRMEEALIKMELDHPSSDSATTTSRTFYPEDPDVEHVHRFTHWRNNTVAAAKDTTSQVFDQIKFIIE
jgi:hypothetical protein